MGGSMNKRIARKIVKSMRSTHKQRMKACQVLKINTDPFIHGTFEALLNRMLGNDTRENAEE